LKPASTADPDTPAREDLLKTPSNDERIASRLDLLESRVGRLEDDMRSIKQILMHLDRKLSDWNMGAHESWQFLAPEAKSHKARSELKDHFSDIKLELSKKISKEDFLIAAGALIVAIAGTSILFS